MKKITTLYAVTALAALSFASQAVAMGGGVMRGNTGGNRNMGSHMQRSGTTGMQHGSGNGSRHEAMHGAGSQHGGMNTNGQQHMMNTGANAGVPTQPVAQAPATPEPVQK